MFRISVILLCFALPAVAQEPTRLSVQPASSPVPAFKYQLLPEVRDLKSGNAALLYQRAHSPEWFDGFRRHADYAKVSDWLELPLDRLPVERAASLLPRQTLKEVDLAARREFCDWELTERVRKDGFSLLMPDLGSFRSFAVLLALRSRLAIRERDYPAAVYSLQTGMALARHTADGPTLINGLVGAAIANMTLVQIEELIQQDGAPNFYWALTDLPRPFIDMRRPLQAEKMMLDSIFPDLREAWAHPERGRVSADKLNRDLARLGALLSVSDYSYRDYSNRLFLAVASARIYPEAKKYLIEHGIPARQADSWPVTQVALMYSMAMYEAMFDSIYRWANVPHWEARPGMLAAEKELRLARGKTVDLGGLPLAEMMMPAIRKVLEARVRVDRRIAALRCVEALRLHAVANNGQFPAKLADVKIAPIPIDPVTGKSFEYRLEDYRALLIGPDIAGERTGIRYELTLRRRS